MVELRSENEVRAPGPPGSRPRFVVVNGDDFGFSAGVNRAIVEAHKHGILSSASLMVTGRAFDDAVRQAKEHPGLAVGLHLAVVCASSALPHSKIPHLVDRDGRFPRGPVMTGLVYQFSGAARRELKNEIQAQLEKFVATGLPLSHVDGHLHMHMHPVVFDTLLELSGEFGIPHIRLPREEVSTALRIDKSNMFGKLVWGWIFDKLHNSGSRKLQKSRIAFSDRVYGLMASGRMTEEYVLELIPQIVGRQVEIYFHPAMELDGEPLNGPKGAGAAELGALLSGRVREALRESGFQVSTFSPAGAVAQHKAASGNVQ